MNSNSKEVKERIQGYIVECLPEEGTELEEKLQIVVDEFRNWYSPYEQKFIPNHQMAFSSFLNGLPSVFTVDAYYDDMRKLIESWFRDLPPTKRKKPFSDDEVASRFHHLIYRELCTLCKKNGVNFPY